MTTWILKDKDDRVINVINDGQYPLKITNKTNDTIYYIKNHSHKVGLWMNSTKEEEK